MFGVVHLLLEAARVEGGGASACQALADLLAEVAQPKFVPAIALIQKPQTCCNDLLRCGIPAALDLLFDELLQLWCQG